MGGSNGGTGWNLIRQGPSLPTGSPSQTTTSQPITEEDLWGTASSQVREDTASSILARPRGVENTLQGETWPFLYPTQGMYPPDATPVRLGIHPSRYRGPVTTKSGFCRPAHDIHIFNGNKIIIFELISV